MSECFGALGKLFFTVEKQKTPVLRCNVGSLSRSSLAPLNSGNPEQEWCTIHKLSCPSCRSLYYTPIRQSFRHKLIHSAQCTAFPYPDSTCVRHMNWALLQVYKVCVWWMHEDKNSWIRTCSISQKRSIVCWIICLLTFWLFFTVV